MTVTNNIYQKQIKYYVFNAVTNSELTELVLVFTTRPAFPTSVKKVNTSFKNVWRTWGPALPTDLMIFYPLGPMNFKNSGIILYAGLSFEASCRRNSTSTLYSAAGYFLCMKDEKCAIP
jgi:hypothetical protein